MDKKKDDKKTEAQPETLSVQVKEEIKTTEHN
jgi:hypothetical protein